MSRAGAAFLILATLAFVASTLTHALLPLPPPADDLSAMPVLAHAALSVDAPALVDLSTLLLQPQDLALAGLLALACAALVYHALRCWIEEGAALMQHHGPGPGHDQDRDQDQGLRDHAPLIVGLLAGAVWPWLMRDQPALGLVLSAVMLAGFLAGALHGMRSGGLVEYSSSLGFAAGWVLQVSFGLFATLLQDRLGIPAQASTALAMLIGAVAAVSVQLRLGRRIGFSLALIWGLIGIAASTVATDATLATVTVLAIAIVAAALVRVTT